MRDGVQAKIENGGVGVLVRLGHDSEGGVRWDDTDPGATELGGRRHLLWGRDGWRGGMIGGELARGPAQGGERVGSAQGKFENLNSFENCTELELAKIMPSQTQKIQIKYGPAGFEIRNNYPYWHFSILEKEFKLKKLGKFLRFKFKWIFILFSFET
jgi:hypothetical protein